MAKALTLTGDKELEKLLRSLGERVQRKALRSAVSAAATPVVKAAKRRTPKQSGLLRRAMGKKVVTNKPKQSAAAIIGARKSTQGTFKGKPRKPSRYFHLVDKPHIGPGGQHVPGKPILQPALDETREQSVGVLRSKLKETVEREALKGGRR